MQRRFQLERKPPSGTVSSAHAGQHRQFELTHRQCRKHAIRLQNLDDATKAVDQAVDSRLIKAPSHPAHPFDDPIKQLQIPFLPDVEALCQWLALSNIVTPTRTMWLQEVEYLWGKVIFDWCMGDELTLYGFIQLTLRKKGVLAGEDQTRWVAVAQAKKLPLLRTRLEGKVEGQVGGLEAISICGISWTHFMKGEFDLADFHMRSLSRLIDLRELHHHFWMYVNWMDLPLASSLFRSSLFPRYAPPDWPDHIVLSQEAQETARRSAMQNIRAFGMLPAHHLRDILGIFIQLHEVTIIRTTYEPSAVRQMTRMYYIVHDACQLHALVRAGSQDAPPEQQAVLEFLAITTKLVAWSLANTIGPQYAETYTTLLARATELFFSTSTPLVDVAAQYRLNPRAILWILYIVHTASRDFSCAAPHAWMCLLISQAESLKLKSLSAFQRALATFPGATGPFAGRVGRAWDDIEPEIAKGATRWKKVVQTPSRYSVVAGQFVANFEFPGFPD